MIVTKVFNRKEQEVFLIEGGAKKSFQRLDCSFEHFSLKRSYRLIRHRILKKGFHQVSKTEATANLPLNSFEPLNQVPQELSLMTRKVLRPRPAENNFFGILKHENKTERQFCWKFDSLVKFFTLNNSSWKKHFKRTKTNSKV